MLPPFPARLAATCHDCRMLLYDDDPHPDSECEAAAKEFHAESAARAAEELRQIKRAAAEIRRNKERNN